MQNFMYIIYTTGIEMIDFYYYIYSVWKMYMKKKKLIAIVRGEKKTNKQKNFKQKYIFTNIKKSMHSLF